MGILCDDMVMIRQPAKEGESCVITVNCPDKTGLGCDLCRIILFFGLTIVRTDVSTDGKWCYIVFWVVGKLSTNWDSLKNRLVEACPSCSSVSGIFSYMADVKPSKPPEVFLLKLCCYDRRSLLHDVTKVLCELELTIERVKVSTTPDGKVMDLFFITDTRELLNTMKRKEDTRSHLEYVLADAMIGCDIEMVGPEITAWSQGPSFLSDPIGKDMFNVEILNDQPNSTAVFKCPSVTFDNLLSPSHTLVQIVCQAHKALLYDTMRIMKDFNIKIAYGRVSTNGKTECELNLFLMQADGKKILDQNKQDALQSCFQMEVSRPLRVALISRGPDTELIVANPVELSGKGRPLVFYDITRALKMLDLPIFSAEIGRYMIGDREWEVYRVLLDEGNGGISASKKQIEETVWKMLMSWE